MNNDALHIPFSFSFVKLINRNEIRIRWMGMKVLPVPRVKISFVCFVRFYFFCTYSCIFSTFKWESVKLPTLICFAAVEYHTIKYYTMLYNIIRTVQWSRVENSRVQFSRVKNSAVDWVQFENFDFYLTLTSRSNSFCISSFSFSSFSLSSFSFFSFSSFAFLAIAGSSTI